MKVFCKKQILSVMLVMFFITAVKAQIINTGDDTLLPTVVTSSFRPIPGKRYIVSGWLKEDRPQQVTSYTASGLQISFAVASSTNETTFTYHTSGDIIEGWQRFIGVFEVPANAVNMSIGFIAAESGIDTYFDDIRVYPFHGNLKSFVYAQDTQRLMAELDENNYATYYEYDQEGGLVRVKKETEKGVYTIQETRSGTSKTITN